MSQGTKVVVSANPRGHFEECVVSGALLPGTHVELTPSTSPIGGRFTYRQVTRANGAKGPVVVLREDENQGALFTVAYTTGTMGFLYWPIAGDELNLLLRETVGTGTANEENIGDLLAIEKTTGELMAGGALASTPYMLLEHLGGTAADSMVWVKYLGNQA